MISVAEAQSLIDKHTAFAGWDDTVPLALAHGRVLGETIAAAEDLPAFDRSAMDGYAVREDDPAETFDLIGEIRAGQASEQKIGPGQTIRIFTGSQLPGPGLKVIIQENVEVQGNRIRVTKKSPATNVRQRGEDARAGEVLLKPGTVLDATALAVLASVGKTSVQVSPRLHILHLTTGDEIVPPEEIPEPGQIRNSNASLIAGLCREAGVEAVTHVHSGDDLQAMIDIFSRIDLESYDMVLISGGSGPGEYDFTPALFKHLGADIHFREVAVRPGKPLIFGTTPFMTVFGLPGNALSHFVCFQLFVRRALCRLLHREPSVPVRSFLAEPMKDTANARETWWPAQVSSREGKLECRAVAWKSSGDITRLPTANALIQVPASTPEISAGTPVQILPTCNIF